MKCLIILAIVVLSLCKGKIDLKRSILKNFENGPKKELFKVYHFLFEKKYELNSEEGINRYKIFKENFRKIQTHNASGKSWKLGYTPFTDLTHEEFKKTHLMDKTKFKQIKKEFLNSLIDFDSYEDTEENILPKTKIDFDSYEEKDVSSFNADVTAYLVPAKDQRQCGSCWTFSTAASLEGTYNLKNKFTGNKLVSLSEQQLVDCATSAGDGCNGGSVNLALKYTQSNGLMSEYIYPYNSGDSGAAGSCNYNSSKATIKNKGYSYCTNDQSVGEFVKPCSLSTYQGYFAKGPFSVYMEADSDDFQNYESGVWVPSSSDCSNGSDHAVTAVGWGNDPQTQLTYVKVRNSWSTEWGENGNFRIKYDAGNNDSCYITGTAFQPTY